MVAEVTEVTVMVELVAQVPSMWVRPMVRQSLAIVGKGRGVIGFRPELVFVGPNSASFDSSLELVLEFAGFNT